MSTKSRNYLRIFAAAILFWVVILVAMCAPGCARDVEEEHGPRPEIESHELTARLRSRIEVYTLADGTRCAVIRTNNGASISCDWNHSGDPR